MRSLATPPWLYRYPLVLKNDQLDVKLIPTTSQLWAQPAASHFERQIGTDDSLGGRRRMRRNIEFMLIRDVAIGIVDHSLVVNERAPAGITDGTGR